MIRRTITALMLVLMSFVVFVGVPQVHARPYNSDACSGSVLSCVGQTTWDGGSVGIHGDETQTIIDNPGGSGQQFYYKYIYGELSNGTNVEVGEIKDSAVCGGGSVEFFYEVNSLGANCFSMNSGDINHSATFQFSWYTSGSGGIIIYFRGSTGDTPCGSGCFYSNSDFKNYSFTRVQFVYAESNASFGGHEIWGGKWVGNQTFNGSNWFFLYDTGLSGGWQLSNKYGAGPTPQGFWNNTPLGGQNAGGAAWTCVYDSTSNLCTIGS